MILFDLVCPEKHQFESWFRDSAAFDDLKAKRQLICPHCGSRKVEKSLMAPAVASDRKREPATKAEIEKLKQMIEKDADYVGLKFVTEARQMHAGEIPERPIYGEAKASDAIKLIEDGVPVLPLPFAPNRKMN